jgi:hypothetical protein
LCRVTSGKIFLVPIRTEYSQHILNAPSVIQRLYHKYWHLDVLENVLHKETLLLVVRILLNTFRNGRVDFLVRYVHDILEQLLAEKSVFLVINYVVKDT